MPEDIATGLKTEGGLPVYVRRSTRRRRTVSAFWEEGRAVVAVPASFSAHQEREWVAKMVLRLQSAGRRKRSPHSDAELLARSEALSKKYLSGRAQPRSIRWVSNQRNRWGSATPAEGSIRISEQLRGMPSWVVDYVLLHELTHLLVASHSPEFWRELESYPETARAKAYLEGVSFATTRGLAGGYRGESPESSGESVEGSSGES